MALLDPLVRPRPDARPSGDALHLRRCTFRRLSAVKRSPLPVYDVACLYPDRAAPIPLGDLESARAICDDCQALRIFRPDED